MTAAALQRLARGYNWEPKGWHLALADHIPPMAVIGIFRHAVVQRGMMTSVCFHSRELADRARHFAPAVRLVLGPVEIEGPKAESY